jgi:hypothetical protein
MSLLCSSGDHAATRSAAPLSHPTRRKKKKSYPLAGDDEILKAT